MKLIYTPTDEMAADVLTKSLSQKNVQQHREQILDKSRILQSGNNLSGALDHKKEL